MKKSGEWNAFYYFWLEVNCDITNKAMQVLYTRRANEYINAERFPVEH